MNTLYDQINILIKHHYVNYRLHDKHVNNMVNKKIHDFTQSLTHRYFIAQGLPK